MAEGFDDVSERVTQPLRAIGPTLVYRLEAPGGQVCYALREGEVFKRLNMTLEQMFEAMERGEELVGGEAFVAPEVPRYLAPVMPGKIVCVGRNFAKHALELGNPLPTEPLLFTKPVSAIIGVDDVIELPWQSELVQHEGELAVVIGKRAKAVSEAEAMSYVLGYTCANDVTARDIQQKEQRFTRAKGFDTFCPLGPALALARGYDPGERELMCRVNGAQRQRSRLNDWIFPIPKLISYISDIMTLMPGDVVLTGTPAGVGPLVDGDVVEVEIEGIGVLRNGVMRVAHKV